MSGSVRIATTACGSTSAGATTTSARCRRGRKRTRRTSPPRRSQPDRLRGTMTALTGAASTARTTTRDTASTSVRWLVPLSDLRVDDAIEQAVAEVVRSGWWSMGPRVAEFEGEFAALTGAKHAFAVANGTAAIHLA